MEVAKSISERKINFPDPRTHEFAEWVLFGEYFYRADDIVLFGGELTMENLREAYQRGIFPWHIDGVPLPWFCPQKRAVLELAELKLPRSLRREWKKAAYTFTIDRAFRQVMENCSRIKRAGQRGTWITADFIRAYTELHEAGGAHSVEVWDGDELIGGLYGVNAGGVFSGESMFHFRSNASKFAVLFLIEHLRERGAAWLDVEVMTPHFKALGAKEIDRLEFLDKLEETQELNLKLF
jgi:leucyl/phenylalanyl-tRNA--protein transferase